MKYCEYRHSPRLPMKNATEAAGRLSLSLNGLATDLDTEHGGTDAKQAGRGETGRTAERRWPAAMRPGVHGETAIGSS
jgi:hypothetical protein